MRQLRGGGARFFRRRAYAPPPGETEPVQQRRRLRYYALPTEPDPSTQMATPITPDPAESQGVPTNEWDPYERGPDAAGPGGEHVRDPYVRRRHTSVTAYMDDGMPGDRAPGDVDSATVHDGDALAPDSYDVAHYQLQHNPEPAPQNIHLVDYSSFVREAPTQVRLPIFSHTQQWQNWTLSGRSIRFLRAPVGVGGPQRYPAKTPWEWGKARARSRFYGPAFDQQAEEQA